MNAELSARHGDKCHQEQAHSATLWMNAELSPRHGDKCHQEQAHSATLACEEALQPDRKSVEGFLREAMTAGTGQKSGSDAW